MLIREQKLQILNEILESPDFKDSKRYQDLLRYLFEESEAGNIPKEITVGIKFFGKSNDFDPKEDTTVRVYINNLRKKLDHFYLTSKPLLSYRLVIAKGHYQVEFIEMEKAPEITPPQSEIKPFEVFFRNKNLTIAGLAFFFLAGFLACYLIFGGRQQTKPYNANVWKEFVSPNARPTLILLGDYYFLYERNTDGTPGRFIRELSINSADDFKQKMRNEPEIARKYVQGDFTYLRPSASWGLASLLPILLSTNVNYSLKLASQFTIDDAKSNNIIFIGSFKNLHNFHKILQIFNISYSFSPAGLFLKTQDSTISFYPKEIKAGNYEKDYAVVAKANGPEGSVILFLSGFAETGVIEAARFVSDPKMADSLFMKPQGSSNSFTAVIETEGINQSIVKAHMHYLSVPPTISPDTEQQQPAPAKTAPADSK